MMIAQKENKRIFFFQETVTVQKTASSASGTGKMSCKLGDWAITN